MVQPFSHQIIQILHSLGSQEEDLRLRTAKEGKRKGARPDQINTLIDVPSIWHCTLERTVPLMNIALQNKKVAFVILAQRQLRRKEEGRRGRCCLIKVEDSTERPATGQDPKDLQWKG